ncbi:hypothetical protein M514_19546 [Trichuris suis]|uniref:Uncharacterized protein n=1 Tax=Trichuris suis TaxID=68888 RepID=A0A085NFN8_9BILA|nr:hypothetical protein M514_19546 [Trichuris suis]
MHGVSNSTTTQEPDLWMWELKIDGLERRRLLRISAGLRPAPEWEQRGKSLTSAGIKRLMSGKATSLIPPP